MTTRWSVKPIRMLLSWAVLVMLVSACGPILHQPLDQGPVSRRGSFGVNDASFDFHLTSSTNCARVGQPITLTLELFNTSSVAYTDVLTTSVVDILIEGARDWYWSDTVPVTQQLRTVHLEPGKSMTLTMIWTVDPAAGTPSGNNVAVDAVIRYRDRLGLQRFIGGNYLLIDVDYNVAGQPCR
jgi:uncharacterized repeat protein (TIGR01451 family)